MAMQTVTLFQIARNTFRPVDFVGRQVGIGFVAVHVRAVVETVFVLDKGVIGPLLVLSEIEGAIRLTLPLITSVRPR